MSYDFIIKAPEDTYERYERNVTYNNSSLLKRAGFHPSVLNGINVYRLIPVLNNAITVMQDNPDYFKQFEPENGWGGYADVLDFLHSMRNYMVDAPDAYILKVV